MRLTKGENYKGTNQNWFDIFMLGLHSLKENLDSQANVFGVFELSESKQKYYLPLYL